MTSSHCVFLNKVLIIWPNTTYRYSILINLLLYTTTCFRGMWWHSRLRHCATGQKVTGSIPDGVTGIFHWLNPPGRTVAPGSTQLLTEMSTRNISWGVKAAGALGWQPYHLHVPTVLKSESLNLLESSGPVQACNGTALHLLQENVGAEL